MLKRNFKIITVFLVMLLILSATTVFANNESEQIEQNNTNIISTNNSTATDLAPNNTQSNPEENTNYKKSDVYLIGDTVSVDYIVDGNLFICANKVYINSQIGGDAFIMANELIIDTQGYIFSNLFVLSNSLDIKGFVYDLYSCTRTTTLSSGTIYRDAHVSCDSLTINGIIGRNAFVNAQSINFNTDSLNNAIIYGNLNYSSKSEILIPDNVVSGAVTFKQEVANEKTTGTIIAESLVNLGEFMAFVLLVWLICSWLAPKFLNYTNNCVGKQTLKVFGIGLLALIAVPLACIILILLQLTAGFSLLILALYIITLAISNSIFVITANKYLCTKLKINGFAGTFGMLVVSGIIIWVIITLPYIGGIANLIMNILGLGVLISYLLPNKFKTVKDNKKENKTNEIKNNDTEVKNND